jgi:transposase InsO family protein
MIAPEAGLSVTRQCALLGIARSSFYYRPRPEPEQELDLLKRLDRIFTNDPVYGSRRLQVALLREGIPVGRRRVRRLMKKLDGDGAGRLTPCRESAVNLWTVGCADPRLTAPARSPMETVKQHRTGTLSYFALSDCDNRAKITDGWGPNRLRSGPLPKG